MTDVVEVIMNMKSTRATLATGSENKNEDIWDSYPCDECGVDNVWDLSFSAFVDHLDEHTERSSPQTRTKGE